MRLVLHRNQCVALVMAVLLLGPGSSWAQAAPEADPSGDGPVAFLDRTLNFEILSASVSLLAGTKVGGVWLGVGTLIAMPFLETWGLAQPCPGPRGWLLKLGLLGVAAVQFAGAAYGEDPFSWERSLINFAAYNGIGLAWTLGGVWGCFVSQERSAPSLEMEGPMPVVGYRLRF